MGRRAVRILLSLLSVALLCACELRAEVNVTVEDDGSGAVEIAVALDEDSAALRPDLLADLDVAHLVDAGWEVTGPLPDDGFQWVRASHAFDDPAEVTALIDAVAGEGGPFRDFSVTRSQSFASSSTRFSGTVDFSGLGGSPILDDVPDPDGPGDVPGEDVVSDLGDRFGAAVDEIVQIRVAVRLPGDVESNAPTKAGNGAVWRPSVTADGALRLEATATTSRPERVAMVVVSIIAAVAAVLAISVRVALWKRRK